MPAPPVGDWEAKHKAVTDILALIEANMPHLTSDDGALRQTIAAYLARCRRLLIAMDTLRQSGLIDVASLPLRPLIESWVVAMWLLYDGQAALDQLTEDYQANLEQMNRLADLGFDPALYAAGDKLPKWQTLFQRVGDRLKDDGQADAREHMDFMYDMAYRSESLRNSHAGLGSVIGHMREAGQRVETSAVRSEAGDAKGEILWAATMVTFLAYRVFEIFGLSVKRLDELGPSILPDGIQPT